MLRSGEERHRPGTASRLSAPRRRPALAPPKCQDVDRVGDAQPASGVRTRARWRSSRSSTSRWLGERGASRCPRGALKGEVHMNRATAAVAIAFLAAGLRAQGGSGPGASSRRRSMAFGSWFRRRSASLRGWRPRACSRPGRPRSSPSPSPERSVRCGAARPGGGRVGDRAGAPRRRRGPGGRGPGRGQPGRHTGPGPALPGRLRALPAPARQESISESQFVQAEGQRDLAQAQVRASRRSPAGPGQPREAHAQGALRRRGDEGPGRHASPWPPAR